ncbi:MAG: DUF1361 domain-containing protein [Verrucomicrobiaceae bacterium]|nr:MAG: DUF1361 domain-containing protein [Verrucomicrobiaceae bacterium]
MPLPSGSPAFIRPLLQIRRHPVFPVLVACAAPALLCVVLLLVRRLITGYLRLEFLPFNLLLAFMPVVFFLISEYADKRWQVLTGGVLWLLFFPNAPYVLTDLIHLKRALGDTAAWLDLLVLLSAAWSALIGGMITLRLMQNRVAAAFSPLAGHGFVILVLLLSSFGIFIGRFLRFHSWHAVLKPHEILTETAQQFMNLRQFPLSWPFTLALFALLLCIHYSLAAFAGAINPAHPATAAPTAKAEPLSVRKSASVPAPSG